MKKGYNQPELQISNKVKNIPEALSVYINNVVYKLRRDGINIITLSLGEAYFDVPFWGFNDIDVKKGYHYSESLGLPELREKIAEYYAVNYGANVNPNSELLISAGSKPIIYMALQTIINEGDEVLVHEPAWLSYPEQIKLVGGIPKYIPYDCAIDHFGDYITEKTKVLVLNNPNNPAGRVYSKDELLSSYQMCRSRGIYILVDEAYSDFITKEPFYSMAHLVPDKEGVIIVNSLSKNLGMSGWRIGYVIATPEIIYNILKLNQHLITCAPTILLMYIAKYFNKILEYTLPQAREVTIKRNRIEYYMREIGLQTLGGSATFYTFISIADYAHTSLEFTLYLLFKYHIAVVPGEAYGKSTERFVRVGVGVEDDETLKHSLMIIKHVIETQEFDSEIIYENMNRLEINMFVE